MHVHCLLRNKLIRIEKKLQPTPSQFCSWDKLQCQVAFSFEKKGMRHSERTHSPMKSISLANRVVRGVRQTTGAEPLSLVDHFYHKPSGLHNEGAATHIGVIGCTYFTVCLKCVDSGVWHNCMMILSYLKLGWKDEALKTAASLRALNFDHQPQLFRSRTFSPYWNHDLGSLPMHYKAQAFQETSEKRCITNAMCVFVWGKLCGSFNIFPCPVGINFFISMHHTHHNLNVNNYLNLRNKRD
jgi:hypothetical protein